MNDNDSREITDKERREIAARLRHRRKEMDNEKCPRIPSLAATVYLLEISSAVKCGESGALFYRLADLIDRPTCTFDGTPERIGYACSNCGQTFTRRPFMKRAFGSDIGVEIPYRFCPYCGAKVRMVDDSENPARKYGLANQRGQGSAETESDVEHDARHHDRDCCHQSSAGCCRGEDE